MLQNHLKIALRSLYKNKVYSLINIVGLSMTLVSAIFISLYFENEFNYDSYHEKKDLIYRLTVGFEQGDQNERFDITAHGVAGLLKDAFPEIDETVRFYQVDGNVTIAHEGDKKLFKEDNFYHADKEVFQVFTHPLHQGNPKTALDGFYKIVISKSLAQKYFNPDRALNKSVEVNGQKYIVTGILEDPPKNSHLYFDALLSTPPEHQDFGTLSFDPTTYILFKPTFDYASFVEKLASFDEKIFLPIVKESFGDDDFKIAHGIDRLVETHFITDLQTNLRVSSKSNLYIFPVVGLLLLVITCMNSANLSISNGFQRNQDIGIRRIIGADGRQIIILFLVEALVLAIISLVIALTLQQLLGSWFYEIIGKKVSAPVFGGGFAILVIILIILLNTIAAILPQYLLSKTKPNLLLKKQITSSKQAPLKKLILTFQFALSLLITIGALIAYQQFTFMKSRDLGFDSEQIMVINLPGIQQSKEKAELLKAELKKYPSIKKVALGHVPMDAQMVNSYTKYGENNVNLIKGMFGDEDYIDVLDLSIIRGANFSAEKDPDNLEEREIIINEAFERVLGWEDPIGQKIDYNDRPAKIVGVVKDYHFRSLHHRIEPLLIEYNRKWPWHVMIKKSPGDLTAMEQEWYNFYPDKPFEYRFLNNELANLYLQEASINQLLWYFSLLILILTCSGLYGISFYAIVRRTKEIGIRKVLGATFQSLIYLLSKDFIKLTGLAVVIAIPVSIIISQQWIEQYAYRIDLDWYVFVVPAILLLLIAMVTMSFQTFKTARENPVEALRYE